MPIVDVEFVCVSAEGTALPNASALAEAIGRALGTPAGRTWPNVFTCSTLPQAPGVRHLEARLSNSTANTSVARTHNGEARLGAPSRSAAPGFQICDLVGIVKERASVPILCERRIGIRRLQWTEWRSWL